MTFLLWTDERIELLKQRWNKGDSCSAIARELGCGKNAVVGKAHRLKLPRRRVANALPYQTSARIRARQNALASAAASALGVALLDLEPEMCRWPIGEDGEHRFCGHPRDNQAVPYCTAHKAIAYVPAAVKKVRAPREYHATTDFDWTLRFGRAA